MSTPSGFRHTGLAALRETLDAALLQAEELLFALAGQSSNEEGAVDLHLDTLRYLRALRNGGAQGILQHLEAEWSDKPPQAPPEPRIRQALERLAVHAEAAHFDALSAIERDLRAAGMDPILAMQGLNPRDLSTAIGAHLNEHPAPIPIQLLLIRLLDQLLVPGLGEVYQRVRQNLELPPPTPGEAQAGTAIDHSATGVLEREALLAHLDRLQSRLCQQPPPPVTELQHLRSVPELPHEATLPPELQRRIDLMGLMVYDAVTDPGVAADLKPILLRMHLPLLKAVLLDPELLHHSSHPVRQLWERLLALARAPEAERAPWRARVERIISHLCLELGHDLGLFSTALDKLRTVELLPRDLAPAMARPTSPPPATLSFNEARNAATQAIHAALAAHSEVVPAVRTFLLQTWGPLLLLLAQRSGAQGEDWREAVAMMEELVALAATGDAPHPERAATLLHAMQDTLKRHGLEQRAFHKAFEALLESLEARQRADTATPPPPPPAPTSEVPAEAEPAPAASLALPPRAVEEFLRVAFRPGDWFLVHLAEDQVPRRLKAYHADLGLGLLVFADRLERPVLELPIRQFVDDVLAGRSHPVFEDERHAYALSQLRQHLPPS